MTEPLRNEEPSPDLPQHEQPASHGGRTRAWYPRLVPEPASPAAAKTPARHPRQLTDDEISYFLARDSGKFFEEDFHRHLEFDRAIDREPEIE